MGHYSDYYEEQAEKNQAREKLLLQTALKDLNAFRAHNALGKSGHWNFQQIGVYKEYETLVNKLKARLYDLER